VTPVSGPTGDRFEPSGRITVEREGDGHVMYLTGDVDAPVVKQVESDGVLNGLEIVAVDVGGLRYIDSTGLSFLVSWAQDAARNDRPAQIRRPTRHFDRVMELAGLTAMFVRT
jgi:anti-anti-sigma factor